MNRLHSTLDPAPPFRLDLTVWVLRRRPDDVIDRGDGATYRRVFVAGGEAVSVAAGPVAPANSPNSPRRPLPSIGTPRC